MSLLDKLLAKRGIKDFKDLSPEERVTFEGYKNVLTGKTLTIKNLEDFCRMQVRIIESRFANDAEGKVDVYTKACLHVYLNLLMAMEAPKVERENMEKYLVSLIKDPNETETKL